MIVSDTTSFTFLGLSFLLMAGFALLCAPRRFIIPIFVALIVFVSMRQRLVIFGLDFMPHRILVVVGLIRVFVRGEYKDIVGHPIDKKVVILMVYTLIAAMLLRRNMGAFVYHAAKVIDALGIYFIFRIALCDPRSMVTAVKGLCVIAVGLAAFMWLEHYSGRNWLSALGAVSEGVYRRAGRIRSQAAFGHPILAGTFGATLLPLFISCCWQRGSLKRWGWLGCGAALVITYTASSSGPLLACMVGIGAMLMWRLRARMRQIRIAAVATLVALQLVMTAPVWALMHRVTIIPGSTGYHRYRLIDEFVAHFSEWWLLGTESTAHWGYYLFDVTNQYIVVAIHGGLGALILFVWILALCFREVGIAWRKYQADFPVALFLWSFGAMLATHCISFLSISYWDQSVVLWYMILAMLASLRDWRPDFASVTSEADYSHEQESPAIDEGLELWSENGSNDQTPTRAADSGNSSIAR